MNTHLFQFQYRYCSEGCCPEEFCAFRTICYPKMHCTYGCPDGECRQQMCMPPKPCKSNTECSFAHVCTRNFNLGYDTCQYNLDIGKTLCLDRNGNSLAKPITWSVLYVYIQDVQLAFVALYKYTYKKKKTVGDYVHAGPKTVLVIRGVPMFSEYHDSLTLQGAILV